MEQELGEAVIRYDSEYAMNMVTAQQAARTNKELVARATDKLVMAESIWGMKVTFEHKGTFGE